MTTGSDFDDLLQELEEKTNNTPLQGLIIPYQQNRDLLEFLSQNEYEITPDNYFRDENKELIKSESLDKDQLASIFENSEKFTLCDVYRFYRDLSHFLALTLDECCSSDTEVIDWLVKISPSRSKDKVRNSLEETYRELRNNEFGLENVQELVRVSGEDHLFSLDDTNLLFCKSYRLQYNIFKTLIEWISWEQEPSVDEYFIYSNNPHQKHVEELDIDPLTEYNIVGKITDRTENEITGEVKFEYEVLSYDTEIFDLWENHWMLTDDTDPNMLEPQHEKDLEIRSESPLGEVELIQSAY